MNKSWFVALTACVALAGCSDPEPLAEEAPSPAPVETTAASPAPPAIPVQLSGTVNNRGVKDYSVAGTNIAVEFELGDFFFGPTFVKALPNSDVTFALQNKGTVEHSFTIASDPLKVDLAVAAGATVEGQLKLPESGVVEFYCRFHVDSGMKGAFYFQDGVAAPAGGAVTATEGDVPTGTATGTGTGTGPATGTTTSSGTAKRTTTAAGTSTAARPAAVAPGAPNRAGDLVIPDLNIGEPQKGASSLNSPSPKPSPVKLPSPKPVATSSPKSVKGGPAKSGTPGGTGAPGQDAEDKDEPDTPDGTDGTPSISD